jgi:hypothetical protein
MNDRENFAACVLILAAIIVTYIYILFFSIL